MSLYAFVDGKDVGQVATIQGWSDFVEWADQQQYETLAHLVYKGYSTKLTELASAIGLALSEDRPRSDIESTALGIQELCQAYSDAEILIVSDGESGDDYDEDDEDEDDPDEPELAEEETARPGRKSKTSGLKRTTSGKKVARASPARSGPGKKGAAKRASGRTTALKTSRKAATKRASVKKSTEKPAQVRSVAKKTRRRK